MDNKCNLGLGVWWNCARIKLVEDKFEQIRSENLEKIAQAEDWGKVDELYLELFGKEGKVSVLPREFAGLSVEELREIGPKFNQLKSDLEAAIDKKRKELKQKVFDAQYGEKLILNEEKTIEGEGHMHPLTRFEQEIVDLFGKLGFQLFSAPHIDSDYYNFEVLNIPEEHPARDLWDTFHIDKHNLGKMSGELILRTHTSNAQVRIMEQMKLPIRMMVLDRCFRYENLDARHEHTFDQFELVYIDKGLSMANLQYLSEYFLKSVLGREIRVRMRPKYYPFVEPGVGIDGECMFCEGKGCKICGGVGWLELGGAGMIHPTVLKNGGIDPEVYNGIAWGPGLERILLLKHGIEDVRLFRNGDLKFLDKF